ncbi:hypothetical protein CGGC5_v004170 [Colletotrichum fructicola Nara gc5]|uniref:Uncharacterized protein n=1 Tax=Colletotrichum fructicola (strain Nara gc5) TaxID=1213859 RepID=A0A7J6JEG5_COLFN|nr:hypothetical protein CGGC5_v004170 [Colletotrichum fructicola Nara gc5]
MSTTDLLPNGCPGTHLGTAPHRTSTRPSYLHCDLDLTGVRCCSQSTPVPACEVRQPSPASPAQGTQQTAPSPSVNLPSPTIRPP